MKCFVRDMIQGYLFKNIKGVLAVKPSTFQCPFY